MNTTASRPLPNAADKSAIKQLAANVVHTCPSLHDSAHKVASDLLAKYALSGLDPDYVYFHRFRAAQSSTKSFTGWEHIREQPHDTQTLTQLVIHRFRVTDQDNADLLDLWAGFYSTGAVYGDFNETNEVRLHGNDVLREFWSIDFSERYTQELNTFWNTHAEDFRTLAKCNFLSKAVQALDNRQLSEQDFHYVIDSVASGLNWPVTQSMLTRQVTAQTERRVYAFDMAGYVAQNIVRIVTEDNRQIVYVPGLEECFQVFDTPAKLHWWVLAQMNEEQSRTTFLYHFGLADRQAITEGITPLMNRLVDSYGKSDHHLINQKNTHITGDAFTWLRDSTRTAMFAEAELSLTSNGDLRKKLWIGYLSAALKVFGPMAAVGWPVALPLLGASIASLGLNIDQAVNGKTSEERKAGVIGAVFSGIDTLFNLVAIKGPGPLLEVGEDVDAAVALETAQLDESVATAAPDVAPVIDVPETWQSNELLDESMLTTEPGQYQGIYKLRDAPWYAIQINDLVYTVRYERDVNGPGFWTIIDPSGSPFSKPIPVRLNASGQWETVPRLGLAGGRGGFLNTLLRRQPAGPAPENPASAYEIPPDKRPALETSASSPYAARYKISDQGVSLDPNEPHVPFKARRQLLFKDAAAFLNRFSPAPRAPIPHLPVDASAGSALRALLRNERAIVLGEAHSSVGSKQLLIDKMEVLAEENVKTLYLEHLMTDFHQAELDIFAESGVMPEKLRTYLQSLDAGQGTDPLGQYNFLELVHAAQRQKIRVQALDCMASYRLQGFSEPAVEGRQIANDARRQAMMNYFASTVIRADQASRGIHKWVALVGNSHASAYKGVPGLDEIEGVLSLRVEDASMQTPGRFIPDPGISTGPDSALLKSDLLFQTPIPVTPTTQEGLERLLRSPGMFTVRRTATDNLLIHRSKTGNLVETEIHHFKGRFFIDQPRWPSIDGKKFMSLKAMLDTLDQMGMILVGQPRAL